MMRRLISLSSFALLAAAPSLRAQTPAEQPPPPGPLRRFVVPPVQSFTLPNGIRVVVVEKRSLPVVSARIHVDAGAVRETREKNGVAVLTGSLLSEGTRELSGAELAERMAALGAQFATGAVFGSANASVTALSNVFPQAFALAATTVTQPAFNEADFNRVRASSIAAFERSMSTAEGVASRVFSHAIFEPATPYSRVAGGTKATLSALTRDDVVNWHRTMYSPRNTTVLFVGDIDAAQARHVVQQALGTWNTPAPQLPPLVSRARPASNVRIILVDRPGSVQTALSVGHAAPGYESPDVFPLLAAAQVLGGGFGARLNMNLREKHGWSYGAFAGFNPLHGTGTFAMSSSVRTNATDSAILETVREFRRLAGEPVPATELRDQLNNVVASFPSSVQSVQGLMGRLTTVITYGLPLDYYNTYRERLAAVTPQDISRLSGSRLTPGALTIVAVGDLKSIEAPVRALNIGSVEVWDADGNKLR